MSTEVNQINYIKTILVDKIVSRLSNEKLLRYEVDPASSLNGFMSAIYCLRMETESLRDNRKICRDIILKFMKGDADFRNYGRVYTQFANEIFIYNTVIPYYEKVIKSSPKTKIDVSRWVPKAYYAKYGTIKGLNEKTPESVLAAENLKPLGFRSGPRLHLDRQHLFLMTKLLAEYHSLTYALRIRGDVHLENLIGGIIPFPFTTEQGLNLYGAVYPPGFERFFRYFDKMKQSINDQTFVSNVDKFRKKYGDKPVELLERFRAIDETWSIILHGDFNRNNVLFRYDQAEGYANPRDIKMIDFQELRYGTPAIDLSFFMYMNMHPDIREDFWIELLKYYHNTVIESITDILNIDDDHESLEDYSFDKFYEHFSKFAFYGALVCIHFIPWMACDEKECAKASKLFETDMYGEEFKKIAKEMGGDEANKIVFEIVHHASRQGYMKNIFD